MKDWDGDGGKYKQKRPRISGAEPISGGGGGVTDHKKDA